MLRNRLAATLAGALLALIPFAVLADREAVQELLVQGRLDEAMQEINTLLAASPEDAELRFMKGIVYAEQGEDDMAIEVFAGLTQDYPELPEPYNNLAVLFAQNGEYDKAREALLSAIQTHPSYSTAHENLGDLYAKMAGNAYGRALQENQSNESARLKLAKMSALFAAPSQASANAAATQAATQAAATAAQTQPPPVVTPEPATPKPVVQAAATQPPAAQTTEPVPDAAAMQTAANQVAGTVASWAAAWASQDVEGYLSFYAPNFRPERGLSRDAWVTQRRDRVSRPSTITVEVSDLFVDVEGAESARAVFRQDYAADTYSDTVIKTLALRRIGGNWQIMRETSRAP